MDIKKIIKIAYKCILEEANSWPCLGLVSKKNSGSHNDMDISTFKKSAKIFINYFNDIYKKYYQIKTFNNLRNIGILTEEMMFKVTNNINTHKGLVFAFGIIFFNFLKVYFKEINFNNLCTEIKLFTEPLKNDYLNNLTLNSRINLLINDARQTALSGYKVCFQALKEIELIINEQPNLKKNQIIFLLILYFYLNIDDTTVINKIGYKRYLTSKKNIECLYNKIKINYNQYIDEINKVNNWAIINNISPGGCGDLVVITLFLRKIKSYI